MATSRSTDTFDGENDTTPDGVVYIVTGAGGAGAYDPDQTDNVPTWQPYTQKLISDVYSSPWSMSTARD